MFSATHIHSSLLYKAKVIANMSVLKIEYNDLSPIKDQKLAIVKFKNDNCGPCRMIKPMYEQLAVDYPDITLAESDTISNILLTTQFRIQGVPTFIIFKQGQEINRIVGARIDELKRMIASY